jgi:hypothetical protein
MMTYLSSSIILYSIFYAIYYQGIFIDYEVIMGWVSEPTTIVQGMSLILRLRGLMAKAFLESGGRDGLMMKDF